MSVGGKGGRDDEAPRFGGFSLGSEPSQDDGFVDFDPDAAIARIRSQESAGSDTDLRALEAIEVLRERASTGPTAAETEDEAAPSPVVDSLPPAHWTHVQPADGGPGGQFASPGLARASVPSPEPLEPDDGAELSGPVDEEEGEEAEAMEPIEVPPSDPRFETVDDPRIPPGRDSLRIGEVARIVGVKSHVLRFWESEFAMVEPTKTSSNQRRFRREDVAALLKIRRLRHDAKLTVAQTKFALERAEGERVPADVSFLSTAIAAEGLELTDVRRRLAELRAQAEALLTLVDDRHEPAR